MRELKTCPICGREANLSLGVEIVWFVECPQCGRYRITDTAVSILRGTDKKNLLPYLSAHVRQSSEQDTVVLLDSTNWENLAVSHSNTPVLQKVDKLLRFAAEKSLFPGAMVRIALHDFPLFDSASTGELEFLLDYT